MIRMNSIRLTHIPRIVFLTGMLLSLISCVSDVDHPDKPVIEKGILDLRHYDLDKSGPVKLDGIWEFYWRRALMNDFQGIVPDSIEPAHLEVPGAWNSYKHAGGSVGSRGYATYRLQILMPHTDSHMAFQFQTVSTAFALYVNNELLGSVGEFSTHPDSSRPEYRPVIIPLDEPASQLDVMLEVSNQDHRGGGIWESVRFGPERDLQEYKEDRLATNLFLFGTILIMAVYHLVLFALRTQDRSTLYFGIFCLLIALRNITTGDVYLHTVFPFLGWEFLLKLEYLTFYMGIPVFFIVLQRLFPREIPEKNMYAILIIGGVFSLLVLFTPAIVFTKSLILYQMLGFIAAVYAIYRLAIALVRAQEGAGIILLGFIILVLAFFNDILYANNILRTGYIISFGVLVFILSQAILISIRFAHAFTTVERQSIELERTNTAYLNEINVRRAAEEELQKHQDQLEEIVRERTSELEAANAQLKELSLVDGLTQIANRRRLDEDLEREWRRMLRDKAPLAVMLADIDFFKFFNDTYGHQEGDACLIQVATAVHNSIKRPGDLAARYGGEEFCVLLPETDLDGAVSLAELVREAVQELGIVYERSEVSDHVTLSIGVAAGIPSKDLELTDLVAHADQALYEAKKNGRNRVNSLPFPAK